MAECVECGKPVVTGEMFCSNYGTKHPYVSEESHDAQQPAAQWLRARATAWHRRSQLNLRRTNLRSLAEICRIKQRPDRSGESLGGSFTGEVSVPAPVRHTIKRVIPGPIINRRSATGSGQCLERSLRDCSRDRRCGMGRYIWPRTGIWRRPAGSEGNDRSAPRSCPA